MILDEKESYVFEVANKNNLIDNLAKTFFTRDCSLAIRFTPDYQKMAENYDEHNRHVGCIVGRNGHHMGVMVEDHTTGDGHKHRTIGFEYWVNTDDGMDIRQIQFNVSDREEGKPVDLVVVREDDKFKVTFEGETKEGDCSNLADYGFSMLWIGAANKIIEDHQHVYYGDIDKLHLQESVMGKESVELFFNNFDSFIETVGDPFTRPVFTGNFKETTPYRLRDLSGNGNHPIIFRKEWMM